MNLNSFMPVKLITGAGCVRASAKELASLGKVCLIVTGKTSARASGALRDVTDALESKVKVLCTYERNNRCFLDECDELVAESGKYIFDCLRNYYVKHCG